MSLIVPNLNESVIVRSAEAEVIGRARPLSAVPVRSSQHTRIGTQGSTPGLASIRPRPPRDAVIVPRGRCPGCANVSGRTAAARRRTGRAARCRNRPPGSPPWYPGWGDSRRPSVTITG
jgi:hypothetical protein